MVLKETDLTPPSFAGVVTFSPVSLRTITACPAFTSRGPTSRRIGTPYKFKIKTSPSRPGTGYKLQTCGIFLCLSRLEKRMLQVFDTKLHIQPFTQSL